MPSDPRPQLRPYQADLKAATYQALKAHRRVLTQLPTGGGKSVVIASVIQDALTHGRSVLLLAHRRELVEQLAERLAHLNPCIVTAGGNPDPDARLLIAMVQTMARREVPLVHLCIIDEAHHAVAGQYKAITDQLPNTRIIGFTATPERLDGRGLGDCFDELVCGPSVQWLMDEGYLSQYIPYSTPLDVGLAAVKKTAGDYNQKHLATFMQKTVVYGDLIDTYNTLAPGRQGIVFAASVDLSRAYADAYNAANIPAAHIDGTTDATTRADAIRAFREGRVRILTNCSLITEGFDVPACDMVQMVRPTQSLSLYLQMVGRALRPSDKPAVILDHAENIIRHGLPAMDRTWELTTTRRRKPRTVMLEPQPIDLPPGAPRTGPEHIKAVMLVPVTPEPEPDPLPLELRRLIETVDRNGYTNSKGKPDYHWAYKRWLETGAKPTKQQLKAFAKLAGYHHMWVRHQGVRV